MGRQFNFFADKYFEIEFINFILECELKIIFDYLPEIKEVNSIQEYNKFNLNYSCYFYIKEFGELVINEYPDKKSIDQLFSYCIQFSRTAYDIKEYYITRGRIWYPTSYWDKNNQLIKIEGEIKTYYDKIQRWLKKNLEKRLLPYKNGKFEEYASEGIVNYINQGFLFR